MYSAFHYHLFYVRDQMSSLSSSLSLPHEGVSPEATQKIGEVVAHTGVSKELIHHYIREEVLPHPELRGQYTSTQVRLLHLIRTLRDAHHLPLPAIRTLFELYDFLPEKMEPLVLTEPLSARLSLLTEEGEMPTGLDVLDREGLLALTGLESPRLDLYLAEKLVVPLDNGEQQRFSRYDANVITLCEHGIRLGIPFESFRAVGSFTRVAFELEYGEFLKVGALDEDAVSPAHFLRDVFVRNEIGMGFIQNLLQTQMHGFLHGLLELPTQADGSLSQVVYQPSRAFLKRHGLEEALQSSRDGLSQAPDELEVWRDLTGLLIHSSLYREAGFYLEEARRKWGEHRGLVRDLGWALLCAGEVDRGLKLLEGLLEFDRVDPMTDVYVAMGLYAQRAAQSDVGPVWSDGGRILVLALRALAAVDGLSWWERLEVELFGGWLLTLLVSLPRQVSRGAATLVDVLRRLESSGRPEGEMPGQFERYHLNAAYLLLEVLPRAREVRGWGEDAGERLRERLSGLICRLDPGSQFAQIVFLQQGASEDDVS